MAMALNKVKKFYKDRSLESQESLAADLTDRAKVRERFAHLLDIREYVDSIKESDECELTHSLEHENRRTQQKRDAAMAAYLPVKLFLSKLRHGTPPAASSFTTLLRFAFGPLHAGLVVGDICIEWDESSLVSPVPVPDRPGDFLAHIDGTSWQDSAGQVVRNMSLANRLHMETPKKLRIIYDYQQQKERVIDDLVDLIVKYNSSKKYSVLWCNCQHFVKDALKVLHVRRKLNFEGNLGSYFDGLRQGVVAYHEYETHAQLDEYVKAKMQDLDAREKEYLLCIYFQFHSAESKFLSPEEQDEWVCPINSCLCVKLDHQINHDSLFRHLHVGQPVDFKSPSRDARVSSLSPNRSFTAPARRVCATPTTEPIREEAVGTNGIAEEEEEVVKTEESLAKKFGGISVEKQGKRLAKLSGYSKQVFEKLQNHPKYRSKSADSLLKETEVLSEKEQFRKAFFSSYIDGTSVDIVIEASSEQTDGPKLSPYERRRRAHDRYEKLFNVDMNLIIRLPTRRDLKTSAAKAPVVIGLQVGDYVYEWDETSLVVPLEYAKVETEPLLLSPVLPESKKWCDVVDGVKFDTYQSIEEAVENNDYSMQIQLHYEVTQKKDELIAAFIDVVMHFNRHMSYSWHCKNQYFLKKAMESLGICEAPKLSTSIAGHVSHLKPRPDISQRQINSHGELDAVTSEVIENDLSRADMEYLIAKYFLFHVSDWEGDQGGADEGSPPMDKWRCSIPECKLQKLTTKLQRKTSISSDQ